MAKRLIGYLLIIWVAGVIAAYFVVHKPWSGEAPVLLARSVLGLVLALALALLAAGLGRKILGDRNELDPLERLALSTAIGTGILGLAVLVVGLLGLLSVWLAWASLVMGLLVLRRQVVEGCRDLASITTGFATVGWLHKSAAGLAVFLAVISLLEAMAPPLKWDSLVYHFELPKQYLQSGRVGFVEDNLYVGFPQLAEMNFTWAMALQDESTAATLGWVVGLIGILGAAGYARRLFGARGAYMLLAVVMSGASLWQGLSWGYVDHWVLLYGTGMFIALDQYTSSRRLSWILVASVCAGFALSTKYSSGVLLFFGSVWIATAWWQSRRSVSDGKSFPLPINRWMASSFTTLARDIAVFSAVALVVALPWFMKNMALTGNPVYPFLFPGREVDALRQSYHGQSQPERTLADDAFLPILATAIGIEGGPEYSTSIGPLFIVLIPGAFLALGREDDRHRSRIVRLLVLGLAVWFAWAVGARVAQPLTRARHYYGVLPAMGVLAVAGFEYMRNFRLKELNVGWIVSGLVTFSLVLTAIGAVFHLSQINPLPVLSGRQGRIDYLVEQLGWYGWAMEGVNELPPGSRVKFLWEPRAYYCRIDCRPDSILDQWWYARQTIGEASEIADVWRDQGYTHVLIYDFGAQMQFETQPLLSRQDWVELGRLRKEELELAKDFGSVYSLYTLES